MKWHDKFCTAPANVFLCRRNGQCYFTKRNQMSEITHYICQSSRTCPLDRRKALHERINED